MNSERPARADQLDVEPPFTGKPTLVILPASAPDGRNSLGLASGLTGSAEELVQGGPNRLPRGG
jgi:hypothetical protein